MSFQSEVNVDLNLGVVGDIVIDEPHRIQTCTLDANGGSLGNFFIKNGSTGVATQGGVIGQGAFTGQGTLVSGSPTLTITTATSGALSIGSTVTGTDIPASTTIIGYGTGTGGVGTYTMSANATATVSSAEAITGAGGPVTVLGGIAVNAKIQPQFGSSATNPLAPSLSLEPNGQAPLMTLGSCLVNIPNAFNVGDEVIYQVTTGELASIAPGASVPSGYAAVPDCQVYGIPSTTGQGGFAGNTNSDGGVAIVRLTTPN